VVLGRESLLSFTRPEWKLNSSRANYAAWRWYRWCSPPTSGIATTRPRSGGSSALGSGASLPRAKCVRDR